MDNMEPKKQVLSSVNSNGDPQGCRPVLKYKDDALDRTIYRSRGSRDSSDGSEFEGPDKLRGIWKPISSSSEIEIFEVGETVTRNGDGKRKRPKNALKKGLKPTRAQDLPLYHKNTCGRIIKNAASSDPVEDIGTSSSPAHSFCSGDENEAHPRIHKKRALKWPSPLSSSSTNFNKEDVWSSITKPKRVSQHRSDSNEGQPTAPHAVGTIATTQQPLYNAPANPSTISDPTSPPLLSTYKQNNTILCIYPPSPAATTSPTYIPVKLRSCMTMSALFHTVARACGLEEGENDILALIINFGGKPNERRSEDGQQEDRSVAEVRGGRTGKMKIKKNIEDSFEIFLEKVERLDCWILEGEREKGECEIEAWAEVK